MAQNTPESLANSPRWDDEAERARDEDPAARATPAPPDAPPSTTTERPDTDEDDRTPAALGDLILQRHLVQNDLLGFRLAATHPQRSAGLASLIKGAGRPKNGSVAVVLMPTPGE